MNSIRYTTELVTVMDVTCDLPRSGLTPAYAVRRTWIGLPTAGVFALHAHGDEHLVHAGVGVIFPEGIEYRMTHPVDGGDSAIALSFRADVIEEALPGPLDHMRVSRIELGLRHDLGGLVAACRQNASAFVDELALGILRSLSSSVLHAAPSPTRHARRKIDRIRIALAEHPEMPWALESLARLVGYSPYHLAHEFRLHTGTSVHRYLADLRIAAALQRIEEGDAPLAAVAADLGFTHHSHMTATLRRRLGVTPRMIRERLRGGARPVRVH